MDTISLNMDSFLSLAMYFDVLNTQNLILQGWDYNFLSPMYIKKNSMPAVLMEDNVVAEFNMAKIPRKEVIMLIDVDSKNMFLPNTIVKD